MFHKLHKTWTAWIFSKCNLILCTFCGNLGKSLIIFYSHNRVKPDGKQKQGGSTQFLWKHLRSKSGPFGNTVQLYLHNKSKADAGPEQFFFKNVVGVRGLNGMRHIDTCKIYIDFMNQIAMVHWINEPLVMELYFLVDCGSLGMIQIHTICSMLCQR